MSKLYDMREALAASIIAADIGWTPSNVILKRQTDLYNDIATAINGQRSHGSVLHIGVAEGVATEDDELEMDVTVPVTIICLPQLRDGDTPEEDLWEDLVRHVSGLVLGTEHVSYRFRFRSFTDLEITLDRGSKYLGRQTIFTKHLTL